MSVADRRLLALALVLLVAGVVLVAAAEAVIASAIGWALVGSGGVLLVSLAFLLVGESEDRDRLKRPHG
jgi:hypothetical protein